VRLASSTAVQFWADAGVPFPGATSDPRVLYDPLSQRWFASIANVTFTPVDNLLLAVSKTDDPTAGWTGFQIPFDGPVIDQVDFPTLGVDADGVFLYSNFAVIVVPKKDLLAVPPTIAHATTLKDVQLGTPNGAKAQPVVDNTGAGLPETI